MAENKESTSVRMSSPAYATITRIAVMYGVSKTQATNIVVAGYSMLTKEQKTKAVEEGAKLAG